MSLAMRWMRMPAQCAPSPLPGSATCRSSAIMRSSFSSTALKETSFRRLRMSRADARRARPLDRIDLNEDRVAATRIRA